MRYIIAALFAILILGVPWLAVNYPEHSNFAFSAIEQAGNELAAVFLAHNPKTVADIQSNYNAPASTPQRKVRILIVPGHEPGYGGAEFGSLKERDMTVELGQDLQRFLRMDPHYQAFIARDGQSWSPELAAYFKDDWNDIIAWEKASHDEISHLIAVGSTTRPVATVYHNKAPADVGYRLYGITKWANENDIDITIHIHFNDDPGHPYRAAGDHSGFAIYVPAAQYGNSTTTKVIADSIFKRLARYNPVSDLPGESSGIVDEPSLIAIGANNTADSASMLIEYAYIYEPQLQSADVRSLALKDLAYQTYLGLQDFFDPKNNVSIAHAYDTLILPHQWNAPITADSSASSDIFALQTALLLDAVYPPSGKSMNDCPRSGKFGPCTKAALQSFQQQKNIDGENGVVGPKTVNALNQAYSAQAAKSI